MAVYPPGHHCGVEFAAGFALVAGGVVQQGLSDSRSRAVFVQNLQPEDIILVTILGMAHGALQRNFSAHHYRGAIDAVVLQKIPIGDGIRNGDDSSCGCTIGTDQFPGGSA